MSLVPINFYWRLQHALEKYKDMLICYTHYTNMYFCYCFVVVADGHAVVKRHFIA